MKKLVLMLAVAASMSFFACGNKEAAQEAETTEPVAVEEVVAAAVDSVAPDTVAVAAEEVVEAATEAAK